MTICTFPGCSRKEPYKRLGSLKKHLILDHGVASENITNILKAIINDPKNDDSLIQDFEELWIEETLEEGRIGNESNEDEIPECSTSSCNREMIF